MKKAKVLLVSTVMILFPIAAGAERVQSQDGSCVNLREEPSASAETILCLEPNTYVKPIRIPHSGRYTWVKDQQGNIWYMVEVPSIDKRGWMVVDYINLDAD